MKETANYYAKITIIFWTAFFLRGLILPYTATGADDSLRLFIEATDLYEHGKYSDAAGKFSQVEEKGISNGKLFYNIGNSALKAGDIGKSVLYYEKALQIIPGDPDLNFNYQYALSLTRDKLESSSLSVKDIFFFWEKVASLNAIVWISASVNLILWSLLFLRYMTGRNKFTLTCSLFAILTIIFAATSLFDYYLSAYKKNAIILTDEISVRSGLSNESTELFKLHAGAKVTVESRTGHFIKISYGKGKIGWIEEKQAGII